MSSHLRYQKIIDKLNKGIQFGLFEDGDKCYFLDGEKISYTALWKALRAKHNLPDCHHYSLSQLCPDNFIGTFNYKFSRHKWKTRKVKRPLRFLNELLSPTYWFTYFNSEISF